MLTRAVSLVFAVLVTVGVCFLGLQLRFFLPPLAYSYDVNQLCITLVFAAASILYFRRKRRFPALLLLIGSAGLLAAYLHDCFIDFGLHYHWFQFGGTDGVIFRGFFEPRENPLLATLAEFLRYAGGLCSLVGVFWVAMRFMQQHLTMRWSQPLAGAKLGCR